MSIALTRVIATRAVEFVLATKDVFAAAQVIGASDFGFVAAPRARYPHFSGPAHRAGAAEKQISR
jgi:hypothetical protein